MAALAHFSAVVGMVAFFELLWYLERWSAASTVIGVIAVISVQRCIFKILIAVFLSREFKHDETNRAWWTVSLDLLFVSIDTVLIDRVFGSIED
jgi:1,3-beta-glucan synthase